MLVEWWCLWGRKVSRIPGAIQGLMGKAEKFMRTCAVALILLSTSLMVACKGGEETFRAGLTSAEIEKEMMRLGVCVSPSACRDNKVVTWYQGWGGGVVFKLEGSWSAVLMAEITSGVIKRRQAPGEIELRFIDKKKLVSVVRLRWEE